MPEVQKGILKIAGYSVDEGEWSSRVNVWGNEAVLRSKASLPVSLNQIVNVTYQQGSNAYTLIQNGLVNKIEIREEGFEKYYEYTVWGREWIGKYRISSETGSIGPAINKLQSYMNIIGLTPTFYNMSNVTIAPNAIASEYISDIIDNIRTSAYTYSVGIPYPVTINYYFKTDGNPVFFVGTITSQVVNIPLTYRERTEDLSNVYNRVTVWSQYHPINDIFDSFTDTVQGSYKYYKGKKWFWESDWTNWAALSGDSNNKVYGNISLKTAPIPAQVHPGAEAVIYKDVCNIEAFVRIPTNAGSLVASSLTGFFIVIGTSLNPKSSSGISSLDLKGKIFLGPDPMDGPGDNVRYLAAEISFYATSILTWHTFSLFASAFATKNKIKDEERSSITLDYVHFQIKNATIWTATTGHTPEEFTFWFDNGYLTEIAGTIVADSDSQAQYGIREVAPEEIGFEPKTGKRYAEMVAKGKSLLRPKPEQFYSRVEIPATISPPTLGYYYTLIYGSTVATGLLTELRLEVREDDVPKWVLTLSSSPDYPARTKLYKKLEKLEGAVRFLLNAPGYGITPVEGRIIPFLLASEISANSGFLSVGYMENFQADLVQYIGSIGSIGHIGSLSADYIGQIGYIGTIDNISTMNVNRIGSIGIINTIGQANFGFVGNIGSIGYIGSIDRMSVNRIDNINSISNINYAAIVQANITNLGALQNLQSAYLNVTNMATLVSATINNAYVSNISQINSLATNTLTIYNLANIGTLNSSVTTIYNLNVTGTATISNIGSVNFINANSLTVGTISNVKSIFSDTITINQVEKVGKIVALQTQIQLGDTGQTVYVPVPSTIINLYGTSITMKWGTLDTFLVGTISANSISFKIGSVDTFYIGSASASVMNFSVGTIGNLNVSNLSGPFQIQSDNIANLSITLPKLNFTAVSSGHGIALDMPLDGDTKDYSGYENDGNLSGAAFASGKFGQALSFDGIDDYVEIPPNSIFISQEMSVSFWFNPRDVSKSEMVIGKDISNSYNWQFYRSSSWSTGLLGFVLYYKKTTGATSSVTVTSTFSTGQWYHVVLTINSEGYYELWVNANRVASGTAPDFLIWRQTSTWIRLGGNSTYGYYNGILDEIRIYNRTLTEDEIKSVYLGFRERSRYLSGNMFYAFHIQAGTIDNLNVPVSGIISNLTVTAATMTNVNILSYCSINTIDVKAGTISGVSLTGVSFGTVSISAATINKLEITTPLIAQGVIRADNLIFLPYNWIPNPSFEIVDSAGSLVDWKNVTRVPGGYNSSYAGVVAAFSSGEANSTIPTEYGEIWRFKGYSKSGSLHGFRLVVLNSAYNTITVLSQGYDASTNFTERVWQATISVSGAKFIVPSIATFSESATFDMLSLAKDVGSINIGNGQITAPKIAAGAVQTDHIRFNVLSSDPSYEAGKMWYRGDLDELRFASGNTPDKVSQIPKLSLGVPFRCLYWFRSSWRPENCEDTSTSGSGLIAWLTDSIMLRTGTTAGSSAKVSKDWYQGFSSWNKRRVISFIIRFADLSYSRLRIWAGNSYQVSGAPSFGVYIDNNTSNTSPSLNGFAWNGSSFQSISLVNVDSYTSYLITIEFIPNGGIYFYVNNQLVGQITSYLPSGTTNAYGAFALELYNYSGDRFLALVQVGCMQEI
jgi:hypothetical protein